MQSHNKEKRRDSISYTYSNNKKENIRLTRIIFLRMTSSLKITISTGGNVWTGLNDELGQRNPNPRPWTGTGTWVIGTRPHIILDITLLSLSSETE